MIGNLGPAELKSLIKLDSRVEEQRNLFCARYESCLDEAVENGWTSWSCIRCQLFPVATAGGPEKAARPH